MWRNDNNPRNIPGNPYYEGLSQDGGFTDSPGGGDSGSPGKGRFYGKQSLRPVTCKQLLEHVQQTHADAEFSLDGADLSSISIVAQVSSVKFQTTNTVIGLYDGTGRIEGRMWKDPNDDPDEEEEAYKSDGIIDDAYVHVMGTLKQMNGRKHIHVTAVRPVKDSYEILHHILQVVGAQLYFSKGPPGGSSAGTHDVQMQDAGNAPSAYRPGGNTVEPDQHGDLPPLERGILQAIKERSAPSNAEGVHVGQIAKSLMGKWTADDISNAIDRLCEGGHIYSTIDEQHYDMAY